VEDWPFGEHLFRLLPAERETRDAMKRLDLQPVSLLLPDEKRPYLWYHN
jgi:hypothetical protein